MKYLICFIAYLLLFQVSYGQGGMRAPNKKALEYYNQALSRYGKYLGNNDSMVGVFKLLDKAIKEDGMFYNAYSEKVAFYCQMDEYQHASAEMKKMVEKFPKDVFVNLLYGALLSKTGKDNDARTFYEKTAQLVDGLPENLKKGDSYNDLLCDKSIALILMGKPQGRAILQHLYTSEENPAIKSRFAGYLNCTKKEQILENLIPGKWN